MKTKIDDGGPAFPVAGHCVDASGAYCGDVVNSKGLSLRDWFAGRMLAQIFATQVAAGKTCTWEEMAEIAYAAADAMIAERKEKV